MHFFRVGKQNDEITNIFHFFVVPKQLGILVHELSLEIFAVEELTSFSVEESQDVLGVIQDFDSVEFSSLWHVDVVVDQLGLFFLF